MARKFIQHFGSIVLGNMINIKAQSRPKHFHRSGERKFTQHFGSIVLWRPEIGYRRQDTAISLYGKRSTSNL